MSKFFSKGLKRAISFESSKALQDSSVTRSKSAVFVDEDGEFHDASEVSIVPS